MKLLLDVRQHPVCILKHLLVLKTNDTDVLCFQVRLSLCIIFATEQTIVRGAIQFDHKTLTWTVEIHDVWSDAMLASELASGKLSLFQRVPQLGLCRCCVVTELFAALLQRFSVV